jgi:hypothetical protein
MNRRELIALSSLALAGCTSAEKPEQKQAEADEKKAPAGGEKLDLLAKFGVPLSNRMATPTEEFYEAHITGILLTALHATTLNALENGLPPTAELNGVNQTVYSKVQQFMQSHSQDIHPHIIGLGQAIALLVAKTTGSADSYTGDPDHCLTPGNLKLAQSLFTVKPQ